MSTRKRRTTRPKLRCMRCDDKRLACVTNGTKSPCNRCRDELGTSAGETCVLLSVEERQAKQVKVTAEEQDVAEGSSKATDTERALKDFVEVPDKLRANDLLPQSSRKCIPIAKHESSFDMKLQALQKLIKEFPVCPETGNLSRESFRLRGRCQSCIDRHIPWKSCKWNKLNHSAPCSRCRVLKIPCLPPTAPARKNQTLPILPRRLSTWEHHAQDPDIFVRQIGRPLLFWAAQYGYCHIIRLLLEIGVPIESKNERGSTSLHIATRFNQMLAVETLLIAGASTNTTTPEWINDPASFEISEVCSSQGETPLQIWFRFTRRELPILRLLIAAGADPAQPVRFYRRTILHFLSALSPKEFNAQSEQMMECLVQKRGAEVDALDAFSETPLNGAIGRKNHRAMGILLAAKADPNGVRRRSYFPGPLLFAIGKEDPLAVRLLLQAKADPNGRDREVGKPLVYAAWIRNCEIVEALLSAGADPSAYTENHENWPTALQAALSRPYRYNFSKRTIQLLLDAGADPNSRNWNGETPLHLASVYGLVDSIRLLLDSGADVNALSKSGESPIFFAFKEPTLSFQQGWMIEAVINEFLEAGADVTIKNTFGKTVLDYAFQWIETGLPQYLEELKSGYEILVHAWEMRMLGESKLGWTERQFPLKR